MHTVSKKQIQFGCNTSLLYSIVIQVSRIFGDLELCVKVKVSGGHVTYDVTRQVASGDPQEAGISWMTRAERIKDRSQRARIIDNTQCVIYVCVKLRRSCRHVIKCVIDLNSAVND